MALVLYYWQSKVRSDNLLPGQTDASGQVLVFRKAGDVDDLGQDTGGDDGSQTLDGDDGIPHPDKHIVQGGRNMAENRKTSNGESRSIVAYSTLIFSGVAITILAVLAIVRDPTNTMTIFNIVLPMFASWVGTILAFYFGRENFELANRQVRELVQQIAPGQRAEAPVTSIMRSLLNMAYFQIPKGKGEQDIKLSELRDKLGGNVTRLPIIDADKKPKYMIHESSIDRYIASGGKQEDTLEMFIATQKKAGFDFGLNKGFVVVSEQATLAAAKRKMEETPSCQDIFVTKEGSPDEPLTGWFSNVRMVKFLEA